LAEAGAVLENKNALVVQPKNTRALGKAIIKLIENKSLRRRLGTNGIKYAKQFRWGEMVKNTEKLYERIIGDRN
jgi:glycosyltransferase involved in cell wall biosynthesis